MIATEEIEKSIELFKSEFATLQPIDIVQKRIILGNCLMLKNDDYFLLRQEVAKNFNVHPNEVFVVGSAKLGFSIAPNKRYRHFGEKSDIDVVIVSAKLFDEFWSILYKYWLQNIIWSEEKIFKDYLFQGWIRPDKLPNSSDLSKKWWEFFRQLTSSNKFGPYKISGALYKNWEFIEEYQKAAVESCITK